MCRKSVKMSQNQLLLPLLSRQLEKGIPPEQFEA